ncbi:MAG: hypothetical protein ABI682_14645 [Acidobacteriota bacterium]
MAFAGTGRLGWSHARRKRGHDARRTAVYLRQNALAERLDNQWSAWPYLVSPVTAPMSVGNLHLRLMESFVANPQVHIAALKNPDMAGGPFLNHDESKVSAVGRRYETSAHGLIIHPAWRVRCRSTR